MVLKTTFWPGCIGLGCSQGQSIQRFTSLKSGSVALAAYLGAECFPGGFLDPCYFQLDGAVTSACRYGETQVTLCVGSVVGYIHVFLLSVSGDFRLLSAIRHRIAVTPPLNVYISLFLSVSPQCKVLRPIFPSQCFPPSKFNPPFTACLIRRNALQEECKESAHAVFFSEPHCVVFVVCVFVHCCGT